MSALLPVSATVTISLSLLMEHEIAMLSESDACWMQLVHASATASLRSSISSIENCSRLAMPAMANLATPTHSARLGILSSTKPPSSVMGCKLRGSRMPSLRCRRYQRS